MSALPDTPAPPAFELQRLKQTVKSRLFDSASHPAPVLTIGRFEVQEVLGQGGMGIVYRAVDVELGREVALKLLRPELGPEGEKGTPGHTGGARLSGEAKSLARLSHPNVVAVFDVGVHEGRRFIAMEYVPGQTLGAWLEHGGNAPSSDSCGMAVSAPVELDAVLEVFRQAGEGLAAAHAVGLVHRDFKPDNVLVGHDGRARVLDFGLARPPDPHAAPLLAPPAFADDAEAMATSLTRTGALLGTPAYMAPEQHLGEAADARSDQFAYCIALHTAVYGHRPFLGDDLRTLSLSIVAGRREPVSTAGPFGIVPPALADLISRGLSVRSQDRFASMRELLDALSEVLSGSSVSHPSSEPSFVEVDRSRATLSTADTVAVQAQRAKSKTPDFALHTMEVERVLERALGGRALPQNAIDYAAFASESLSGRPALGPEDLRAVAHEAGIDPVAAEHAAIELVAARTRAPVVVPDGADLEQVGQEHAYTQLPTRSLTAPPENFIAGMQSSVVSRKLLHRSFGPAQAGPIARTLDRAFGERGECEFIGPTLVWNCSDAEVTLAPTPSGTAIVLERSLSDVARRRRGRAMKVLGLAGFFFALIISDIADFDGDEAAIVPLLMMIYTALGLTIGHFVPRRAHRKLVAQTRERLDWTAQRVEALLSAPEAPELQGLGPGPS